jgi:hypothetical protein
LFISSMNSMSSHGENSQWGGVWHTSSFGFMKSHECGGLK